MLEIRRPAPRAIRTMPRLLITRGLPEQSAIIDARDVLLARAAQRANSTVSVGVRVAPGRSADGGFTGPEGRARSEGKMASRSALRLVGPIGRRDELGRGITSAQVASYLLDHQDASPIAIELDSPGGAVSVASRINRLLIDAGQRGHVSIHVTGECSSAALLILLAGHWRSASARAHFHVHGAASAARLPERWSAEEHRLQAEAIEEFDLEFAEALAARCGGRAAAVASGREMWRRLVATETTITADDALTRWGLIDEVR